VMRESTEGKWINRIEELWIRIDDRNKAVGDSTRELFRAVAAKVTSAFNRIVGTKIISLRMVGLSGSLSFTSVFLFFGLFFALLSYFVIAYSDKIRQVSPAADKLEHSVPLLILAGLFFFAIGLLCAALAILPIVFKSRIWVWLSCFPTILFLSLFLRSVYRHLAGAGQFGIVAALALSLASDIILLVIVRESLKWALAITTIPKVAATIAIQLVLLSITVLTPAFISIHQAKAEAHGALAVTMLMLFLFNVPTALASAALVSSLVVVLLHRITWPFLSQWTYVLVRKDVLEKRKTVRTIAGFLIVYGLSGLPALSLVLKIFEKFNK